MKCISEFSLKSKLNILFLVLFYFLFSVGCKDSRSLDEKFKGSVGLGMSYDEVRDLMGSPMEIVEKKGNITIWRYTRTVEASTGESRGNLLVKFRDSRVIKKEFESQNSYELDKLIERGNRLLDSGFFDP